MADHGESFGDHGEYTHGYMLQETTVQIPLVMRARGTLPGGLHLDRRVSQVDVMPTVLSLLGIDVPGGLDGVDLVRPADPLRMVMAENLEARVSFGWSRLSALYQGPFKLVSGTRPSLYDLTADPLEANDLAAAQKEHTARLEQALKQLRGVDGQQLDVDTSSLKRDEIDQLQALGYVVADRATAQSVSLDADGPGADPRDWTELLSHVQNIAMTKSDVGFLRHTLGRISGRPVPANRDDAVRLLESIADEVPDFTPALLYLREFYREQQRNTDVERLTERIKKLKSTNSGGSNSRPNS